MAAALEGRRDLHGWCDTWAERLDVPCESEEYLQRVWDWRLLWRPERVRVLLGADSHLAERPGDLDVQVVRG